MKASSAQIIAFRDAVLAQLDFAIDDPANDGRLHPVPADTNLYACRWTAPLPRLPHELASLMPFRPEEQVQISARYRYGAAQAMVNIWISSADDGPHRSFSLSLRVDPDTHAFDEGSPMNRMGTDGIGRIPATPTSTLQVMDAIFAGIPDYEERAPQLDIVDAFLVGIVSRTDLGAEPYTMEEAEKHFLSDHGHYHLTVSALNRAHPSGRPCRLSVELKRAFRHIDYSPPGLYSGLLIQTVEVEVAADGSVLSCQHSSKVRLGNEPAVVQMGIREAGGPAPQLQATTMVVMNEVTGDDLPEGLRGCIYPDTEPTTDDLAYFQRLVCEPIRPDDFHI